MIRDPGLQFIYPRSDYDTPLPNCAHVHILIHGAATHRIDLEPYDLNVNRPADRHLAYELPGQYLPDVSSYHSATSRNLSPGTGAPSKLAAV